MELYKGQAGSPVTNLASAITATQTTITVNDGIVLPDAPNIATIWSGTDFETFRYGAKTGNTLSDITRGVEGSPMVWAAGTEVARFFTAYDHQAIIQAIKTHQADYATFKSKFTGSFASIGWRKLPDGTIEQWGYLLKEGLTANAWNSFAVSFPVAFTNNVWHVAPAIYPYGGAGGTNGFASYGHGITTQFTAYAKPDSSGKFYYMWRAIGV